jgi:hypothetical protein
MPGSYEEGAGDGSTAQQAKEQAREKAGEVQQKAQQQAQQAKGQAREKLREQVGQRTTQAGERVGAAAGDARSVAEELRRQGKETPAKYAEQAAERAERLGGYLKDSDGDTVLRDVEDFARSKPWAVAAGGLALGFVASRLLKASSSERYRQSRRSPYGEGAGLESSEGARSRTELGYGSASAGTPSPAVPAEPSTPAVTGRT